MLVRLRWICHVQQVRPFIAPMACSALGTVRTESGMQGRTCVARMALIESLPSVNPQAYLGLPSESDFRLSTCACSPRPLDSLHQGGAPESHKTRQSAESAAHPQAQRLILCAITQPLHPATCQGVRHAPGKCGESTKGGLGLLYCLALFLSVALRPVTLQVLGVYICRRKLVCSKDSFGGGFLNLHRRPTA